MARVESDFDYLPSQLWQMASRILKASLVNSSLKYLPIQATLLLMKY